MILKKFVLNYLTLSGWRELGKSLRSELRNMPNTIGVAGLVTAVLLELVFVISLLFFAARMWTANPAYHTVPTPPAASCSSIG